MKEEMQENRDSPQNDEGIFSGIVTAISLARESANLEFNRFWDKYFFAISNNSSTAYNQVPQSKNDITLKKTRKNLQSRMVADGKRDKGMKDAEIQTEDDSIGAAEENMVNYSTKRKNSLVNDELNRTLYNSSKKQKYSVTPEEKNNILRSPLKLNQHDPIVPQSTKSVLKQSPERDNIITGSTKSTLKRSPERANIVTGSTKSVKRLTFELEEALSPRLPTLYSPIRTPVTNIAGNADPFNSTPIVKATSPITTATSPFIKATPTSLTKATPASPFTKATPTSPLTKATAIATSPITVATSPITTAIATSPITTATATSPITTATATSPITTENKSSPGKRKFTVEEEDERLERLEKKICTMKAQVRELISPSMNLSPVPSHTITSSDTTNDTKLESSSYSPRYIKSSISPSSNRVNSPIFQNITSHTDSRIETSPSSQYSTAPSKNSILSHNSRSPSYPLYAESSIPSLLINPPINTSDIPSPPLPPPLSSTSSSYNTPSSTYVPRFTRIKNAYKASLLIQNATDIEDKPSDIHKSRMNQLIISIPFCQLRKADKIIGPDGKERPNPFWNEIYGGRKL